MIEEAQPVDLLACDATVFLSSSINPGRSSFHIGSYDAHITRPVPPPCRPLQE